MTIRCPKCQHDNPNETLYCGQCATLLKPTPDVSVTKTMKMPPQESGRRILFAGRYEIIEELGSGGMGKVYRVEDTKLKQEIALKLIKPEIAQDKKTIERFKNELKLGRNVRHKNICGMFDLGEANGEHFITMEYVRGEDLKTLIKRLGQLPIGKSISIAKNVCEGLAEAHGLGVIHRDLKSHNLMIDHEGHVRIMDFGIARSLEATGLTGEGVMIGTPEYMSPEQVEGKDVDQRSDIYSLGVILYEMVTGRVPFEGDTPFTIGMKHKAEIPSDPKEHNRQIPDDFSRLILRCLEKEREKRYQSSGDLWSELENIEKGLSTTAGIVPERKPLTPIEIPATVSSKKFFAPVLGVILIVIAAIVIRQFFPQKKSGAPTRHSIAVLPFADGSPLKDQGYLCEGMTDEIIAKLSALKSWKVISRTSVIQYKDTKKDILQIGRELGVSTILEGSIRKEEDRIRVTVWLVNAEDRFQLWSQTYEQKLESVFAIQIAIAEEIARALKIPLSPSEETRLQMKPTENLEAYNLYLQGRFLWNKRTPSDLTKSLEFYKKAIEKDPNFALAHAGIADSYINLCDWGILPRPISIENAKSALNHALGLNDSLGEPHGSLGYILYQYEWVFESAEKEFKLALELNPNNASAHQWYAEYLAAMGRFEEAYREFDRAHELDPLSLIISAAKGLNLYLEGRYEDSIKLLKMTLEIDAGFLPSLNYLSWNYMMKGMYQEAIEIAQKAQSLYKDSTLPVLDIISIHALSGQRDKAQEMFDDLLTQTPEKYVGPSAKAKIYCLLGERENALDWIEKAYEERSLSPEGVRYDKLLDSIRPDPRFQAVLKKMNLKQ